MTTQEIVSKLWNLCNVPADSYELLSCRSIASGRYR